LWASLDTREPDELEAAALRVAGAAYDFVQFVDQLMVVPVFSELYLRDLGSDLLLLIKILVEGASAATPQVRLERGRGEREAVRQPALELERKVRELERYIQEDRSREHEAAGLGGVEP